jgi:UDP-glucuronate 4-epimerase
MDYIKEIENNLGIEAIKEFHPLQPGDVKATTADITNIQTQLGLRSINKYKNWRKEFCRLV